MKLTKRTYALPEDTLEEFEQSVASGQRSALIALLLQNWLDEQKRAQLRASIVEGCREMSGVYLETEAEYHSWEEEVERNVDG